MGIATLFDHPRTLINPRLSLGSINVNTPQELVAEVERANAQIIDSLSARHPCYVADAGGQIDPKSDQKAE